MRSNILFSIFTYIALSLSFLKADILTISQAYSLALKNSNIMRSAEYQLESNKETLKQIEAELYPQIHGSISHSKINKHINDLIATNNREITETSTDYTILLSQAIYNPQIQGKLRVEKTKIKLYEIDNELKKQELAKIVLQAYMDILKSKNQIRLLQSYSKYYKYNLDSMQKKFDLRLVNKMDFLQARVEFNRSKLELEKEKLLFKVYKSKLNNLIDAKDFKIPILDISKLNQQITNTIYSKVKHIKNFASNLEVQQSKYGIIVSKQNIQNASAGHKPTVNFDALYTSYNSDDITTDYENTKKTMLTLKVPIYQGGLVTSKITASKLALKAANRDMKETNNNIKARYDELIAIITSSISSVNLYKESLELTKLYYDSIELGHKNGLKSIIDLYDAQNKVIEVEYKYIENIYELMDSYIGLLMVTNNFGQLKLLDKLLK